MMAVFLSVLQLKKLKAQNNYLKHKTAGKQLLQKAGLLWVLTNKKEDRIIIVSYACTYDMLNRLKTAKADRCSLKSILRCSMKQSNRNNS
jgi:hypothetical protein